MGSDLWLIRLSTCLGCFGGAFHFVAAFIRVSVRDCWYFIEPKRLALFRREITSRRRALHSLHRSTPIAAKPFPCFPTLSFVMKIYFAVVHAFFFFVVGADVGAEQKVHAAVTASDAVVGFAISEESDGLTITVDGDLFARYVIDQANKPYLWPIHGPTGKSMTRAYPMQDVASEGSEQRDHPHHRGLLFGHENIVKKTGETSSGGDTWHERATFEKQAQNPRTAAQGKRQMATLASIVHRDFTELEATSDLAVVAENCDYVDQSGNRFLTEHRRMVFSVTDAVRMIDFQQVFTASDGEVVVDDRKDAGLSIRVPTTMAVVSNEGGHIINSDGLVDGEAWSQAAKWCDYHGPVEGEHLGIAILNHPSSYRFPTRWHVREYGLFTANPFAQRSFDDSLADGAISLQDGEQLTLKHRFIFHQGDAVAGQIEQAWQSYAKEGASNE